MNAELKNAVIMSKLKHYTIADVVQHLLDNIDTIDETMTFERYTLNFLPLPEPEDTQ